MLCLETVLQIFNMKCSPLLGMPVHGSYTHISPAPWREARIVCTSSIVACYIFLLELYILS